LKGKRHGLGTSKRSISTWGQHEHRTIT